MTSPALRPIWVHDGDGQRARQDALAVEAPLQLRVNGADLAITMRSPGHDVELALGFLFTEGLIADARDVRAAVARPGDPDAGQADEIEVTLAPAAAARMAARDAQARSFAVHSACGVCGKRSLDALTAHPVGPPGPGPRLAPDRLRALPAAMHAAQEVFARTGGLHATALFDARGALLLLREDVGRHNALDKLLGARLQAGAPHAPDEVLLLSGRASFELVQKARMARIGLIAAIGAPSTAAVDHAAAAGMTLIGFLRDGRFNVYCGAERLANAPAGPDAGKVVR